MRSRGALIQAWKPANGMALYRSLYLTVREAIVRGTLPAGTRLPSTRALAQDARVSRKTAEEAYALLEREGYLQRRTGSGSFVAGVALPRQRAVRPSGERRLAARLRVAAAAAACAEPQIVRAFAAGLPALDAFPFDIWRRVVSSVNRRLDAKAMVYGDPAGLPALREAVAGYVAASRGVQCDASQVIIVNSSQQALDLAARALLDPSDEAWLEDPGYYGARAALAGAGARIVPVPVDGEGMQVGAGIAAAPRARLACVTPSNQYPLGVTMSLERRLQLLDWARKNDAWIVEDDYDSEFRYDGRPLASIQGLDTSGRVLYVGTFTKTLFPSLRLAYLIVPPDLVQAFVNMRTQLDGHCATFSQSVVAEFLTGGHFGAHVRRMRELYRARRDVLLESIHDRLGSRVIIGASDAGLRMTAFIESSDRRAAERAARRGIDVTPLSRLYAGKSRPNGLVLGYAALSPPLIRAGVEELRKVL